jgi:hypothetical protein
MLDTVPLLTVGMDWVLSASLPGYASSIPSELVACILASWVVASLDLLFLISERYTIDFLCEECCQALLFWE